MSEPPAEELCDKELDHDFHEILDDFPQVLLYINRLLSIISRQTKTIQVLLSQKTRTKQDVHSQTEEVGEEKTVVEGDAGWGDDIADEVRNVAEDTLRQNGFVYEPTSGMYYDYNSGYYYNAEAGMYYDGNSGTYVVYDEETKQYLTHPDRKPIQQIPASKPTEETTNNSKTNSKKRRGKHKTVISKFKKSENITSDLEEGELSTSSSSGAEDVNTLHVEPKTNQADLESAAAWPPCMRIIVQETNLPQVKTGSLFLVTYTGGSLGREGDHAVLLPDINISKYHAQLKFNETEGCYTVTDLGSRNGTFMNGKRLSVALQESPEEKIDHGSVIQVGGTKLLCHVHTGRETCGQCEPGLLQTEVNDRIYTTSSSQSKLQHKEQLWNLKKKFGVSKRVETSHSAAYEDRAELRRNTVGSSHSSEKTDSACVNESIKSSNKGFKLLSKMGWSEGQSLGKASDGIKQPVPLVSNEGKSGLGAVSLNLPGLDKTTLAKQKVWRKTQERFQTITNVAPPEEDSD